MAEQDTIPSEPHSDHTVVAGWQTWPTRFLIQQHGREYGLWLARPPRLSPHGNLLLGGFRLKIGLKIGGDGTLHNFEWALGYLFEKEEGANQWQFRPIDEWGELVHLGGA